MSENARIYFLTTDTHHLLTSVRSTGPEQPWTGEPFRLRNHSDVVRALGVLLPRQECEVAVVAALGVSSTPDGGEVHKVYVDLTGTGKDSVL